MIQRKIENIILKIYNTEKNIFITGARQAGKTTLLKELLPLTLKQEAYYLNFDSPDLRLELKNNAIDKINRIKSNFFIFDEVQKMPEIFDVIKYLIDSNKDKHYFLTGSSQILMLKNIQESLAGRIGFWNLYPLSYSELIHHHSQIYLDQFFDDLNYKPDYPAVSLDEIKNQKNIINKHKLWGGYPAVWNIEDDDFKYRWLENYKKSYLEKDIRDLSPGIDLEYITKLINLITHRTANILSLSDLARDCTLSVTTVKNYLKLFELTYQLYFLKPYYENQTKRMIKSPKIYFLDTGLARVINQEIYQNELSGPMYETWIMTELIKWQSLKIIPPEIYYYRTQAGLEIDFLIKFKKDYFIPIEVKNKKNISPSDIHSLKRFIKENNETTLKGILVYPGDEIVQMEEKIFAIPDWILFG
jgi:uncharacterized protein